MGIIKAATSAIGGGLADQWLEVIEPDNMSDSTVMTKGVKVRRNDKRGSNRKGTEDVITDGSVIHVYPNMMMLLVDGGRIIDYTAEEGYYTVKNELAPSMLNGSLKDAISETFDRFKFGGVTPQKQQVFYINLQEIKGIRFGTSSPLNYFDNFYNAELFLRAHGNYSLRITDPILFYTNAIPKNKNQVDINDINEQYLAEFLTALQTAINKMSADGERISYVPSKSMELSKYMGTVLDDSWRELRGMEIVSVAVASITYTDDSVKLINMRNQGAMLGDPSIREGYVQGSVARGMESAGSNAAGATTGFVGMGMGMNAGGGYLNQASQNNQQQMQQQQAPAQSNADHWDCPQCGTSNTGKFCSNCGTPKPTSDGPSLKMKCSDCGEVIDLANGIPKFCPNCGKPFKGVPVD
ncbi:SPFH domain-containing protein [Enterococcus casseliflavus]|uniref:SPFH domain-containing protein n=1 Tax=Enterococcus casseliflavus TaxID=37734 RepID=UPI000EB27FF1|nr:SPFH domain-containing protein [Enterococcus casseliflavus]AYJ45498.1 virion core protein [Enterococcus casseliflavus]MBS5813738.1 SPFH domain-containing protein [Enterococcus casseliflavus]MCD4961166.1 SPFH domain-containing protein [Enterococcus casseliflavus]MDU3375082.1 SPFH domain-containing protein [Enterococcus casseliflavus]